MFAAVNATAAEIEAARVGDDLIASADVVMNRGFTVDASPDVVWPWLLQLGKRRAGWYMSRRLERFIPSSRRALRTIDPKWQDLKVGDVIPDYGGKSETFELAVVDRPKVLVYTSKRGKMSVTWSITLTPVAARDGQVAGTRLHLRLSLGPVHRKRLAETAGEFVDMLTIAWMAAGLAERVESPMTRPHR
jgi:hypothetical protein